MNICPLKLTGYMRISIGGLIALNHIYSGLSNGYEWPQHDFERINELGFFLIDVVYISYCLRQGTLELKGQNSQLPYPRILAILFEMLNVTFVSYILVTLKDIEIFSPVQLIFTLGMAFLLIQNLRILLSKK